MKQQQRKGDLTNLKSVKQFIKKENTRERMKEENILVNREIGYIVYAMKNNDLELLELLRSLNSYSN